MISDEVLKPMLDGSQGVDALDVAREVLALRAEIALLRAHCESVQETCTAYAATAEMAMGECAKWKGLVKDCAEGLAERSARLQDALSNPS